MLDRAGCLLLVCVLSWNVFLLCVALPQAQRIPSRHRLHRRATEVSTPFPLHIPSVVNPAHAVFNRPSAPTLNRSFPDHAGIYFLGAFGQSRIPQEENIEAAERHWRLVHDDSGRESKHKYPDDIADMQSECQRQNWSMVYHPNCNSVHEVPLVSDSHLQNQVLDNFYISHGFFRDVWGIYQVAHESESVWKTLRWEFPYSANSMFTVLRDAVIMEELSASPHIIDSVGHCGTTVWVESMSSELEPVIVPGEGYMKQEDLHDELDVRPQNNFTVEEKLDIAIAMAESLAVLHGSLNGMIVHYDVQLSQWLRDKRGNIKFGDFNLAAIPDFNYSSGEYCTFGNKGGDGSFRSPEELTGKRLTEKVDVYSFGNSIYGLLTGLWIFYDSGDDEIAKLKVRAGEVPFIDDRYRVRSYIEGKMVEIMERCWSLDPKERIGIFEVVDFLHNVKQDHMKSST